MATDKLINHSQGESIITNLGTIATNLQNVTAISPAKFGMGYAVCDTAAGTAAKTANIANYVLTEGALVTVKFTNANTASNATLNLNNTGAKPLLYKGSALTTDIISAGDICTFIYSTANGGSYSIINVDALSGAGAGTVKSVGAEGGITTDQTSGAAISTTGSVKLNLKSNTAFTATAPDPIEIAGKIYPVALDKDGHPAVSVPGSTYTGATGSAISVDNTNNTIDVVAGTTSVAGVVQLTDSYSSTSATTAATPNAVKAAYDLADSKYAKPQTGIPATDLATAVQTSLTAADNAVPNTRTINGTALSSDITLTAADVGAIATTAKGANGGVAELDSAGKVPSSQLPSYVDDVLEYSAKSSFPAIGETGKIYVDTTTNLTYRWSGTAYVEISPSLALGETSSTAYRGDRGKTAYDHSQVTSGNPHNVTASDVGLGNVTNNAQVKAVNSAVTNGGIVTFGADGATVADSGKTIETTLTANSDAKVPTSKAVATHVTSAISGKQDTLTFDGTYNASTNKAATVSTVTNAINALDVSAVTVGATKTLTSISQTDGKISATATDIQTASTSQKGLVQLSDSLASTSTALAATANAVKTVNDKAETNKSNILSVEDMVCATEFSSSTAYAVGDMVTYEHKLYKFINTHQGAWSASDVQNYDLTRMVSELQKKAVKVYTYHVNPNESDPEDAVTYLDDASGLTPAKMGASSFSYGSWANAWFLPRPCVLKFDGTVDYYLNPNDYSKKTDGTASTIDSSNSTGNVMLEFPKIWVKRVNDGNGARTVSIAPVNVDGTYKCWSNINAEDKEVDHFYLPAYNGTIHSSKMRSLSGVTLNTTYAPNYTRAQEVTAATANNPTGKNMWYTETWADFCLIYDLLYLMGKSLDVQRTFGQGLSSGSETAMRAYVTGTHNAKGLFYGDISGTSTAIKVLGMENLWGCRWHGVAGLINDNGTLKVKMTYGVADGSTTVGYNTTGSGYLNYGSTYGTNGYVKKMQADNTMGYKVIETAGTDATYYCDYYYVNNNQSNYALLGGSSGSGANGGFYVNLRIGAAIPYWDIGGSLSCRP